MSVRDVFTLLKVPSDEKDWKGRKTKYFDRNPKRIRKFEPIKISNFNLFRSLEFKVCQFSTKNSSDTICGISQTVSRFPHKLYKSDFTVFVCLSACMKTRSGNISERSQTELNVLFLAVCKSERVQSYLLLTVNTIRKHILCFLQDGSVLNSVYCLLKCVSFSHRCSIRFPSTSIRLFFESLLMEESESAESDEMPSPPKMSMKPLNINIPHHGERERYVIVLSNNRE